MSDLDRLIEIARLLPPEKIQALLAVAERLKGNLDEQAFFRRINSPPPLDVDPETAAELRAALAECGETVSREEALRELGLA